MKLAILACFVVGVLAEPPRFRPARFRFQRIELAPTTTDSPTESTTDASGPYAPSGWKPAGQPFTLPNEQAAPDSMYGAPQQQQGPYPASGWKPAGQPFSLPNEQTAPDSTYGAPQQQQGPYPASGWKPAGQSFSLPNEQQPPATSYGVPDNSYGAPDNTYGAPDAEATTDVPSTDKPQAEKLDGPVEVQKSIGEYYVLLPDGRLQRVEFMTEKDIQNMKYTARLQLRNPAPLFVFGP